MPPEVNEQRKGLISSGREKITHSMKECTDLLTRPLIMLTLLHKDPTLKRLETEAIELQQAYANNRGTMQMVVVTQCLSKMKEA